MADKEVANASLDFDSGKIEFKDDSGNVIAKDGLKERTLSFAKKAIMLTPMGLSYKVGKSMIDRGMDIMDRAMNENELNKVENISFEQVIDLINDGKDKFDELDMTFQASQVNGFSMEKVAKELAGKNVNVDMGKKGALSLSVKVKYKV